jgi:hypothetical protein
MTRITPQEPSVPKSFQRALPWATAAGAIALVAGTIAGQVGAGAVTTSPTSPAAKAATAPAVNALGVPMAAPATAPVARAATAQAPSATGQSIAATPATRTAVAKPAKAAKAGASTAAGKYSYFDSDFILRLRAAAVEPEADIPHPLVPGVGYSAVNLEKDTGGPVAKCEIFGAGYYATDIVQEGILENSGPPDAGNKGGGIHNPTESKDTAPNLSPGENLNSRKPRIKDVTDGHTIYEVPHNGNGVRWEAHCDDDAGGTGTGMVDLAGAQGAGSTTTGKVDKKTGEYIGVSRAFVAGITTGSGTLDTVSSTVKIKHLPGMKPVIDYRIAANGGTLAEGANVPYGDLTKQFNDQIHNNSAALAALGPFGIALMGPTESVSENGGRYIINFPFFEIMAGLEARKGTAGENQRARLVNVDYEGLYQGAAFREPGSGGH